MVSSTKLTKDSQANQIIDVICRKCKQSTRHMILSDTVLNGSEGDESFIYQWKDEYQIVQCQGCETISFRKTHSNSEDFEHTVDGEIDHQVYVDIYPNPQEGRSHIEGILVVPPNLQRIYKETIRALNSSQPVLTGIGIRAIVETVCKDKMANGNGLLEQINDLVAQSVLTQTDADILHKLRTLGNDAAHEVKPHDSAQLGLALDVIDHLLQGVYILTHYTKAKFK